MSDARFPLRVRLRQAAEYKAAFSNGRRQSDACFTVISRPTQTDQARLGMVVSRKVSRLAVQRNRIKRQIRESFRHHQVGLPKSDLVVMARYDAAKYSSQQLAVSLAEHWQKLPRQPVCAVKYQLLRLLQPVSLPVHTNRWPGFDDWRNITVQATLDIPV